MRVLRAVLGGRSISYKVGHYLMLRTYDILMFYKRKVQTLAEEFDEGPGV